MKKILLSVVVVIVISIFLLPRKVSADVIVNEFAVDSSPQQVEIFNTGTSEVDISSWYIDDNGGTTYFAIPENTFLMSNSCIVFSGEFNLNKSSADAVRLFDKTASPPSANAHLIDSVSYAKGPGLNNSFLRIPDGEEWQPSISSFGHFNSTGMSCLMIPTSTATSMPTATPTPTATITPSPSENPDSPISYDNIYINEVLVYPESGTFEKIEFFNNNDFSVTLLNWFIDDAENAGSTPRQFSLTIPAKGYTMYELVTGIFNNDADQARLLDFNKQMKDSFEYSSSIKGKSWGRTRIDSDTFCLQETSFGTENNNCIVPSPTSTPTPASSKTTKLTATPTIVSTSQIKPTQSQLKQASSPRSTATNQSSSTSPSENSSADIYNQTIPKGEVLGEDTGSQKDVQKKAFFTMTLFTSSSYSILAFAALLIKVKQSL